MSKPISNPENNIEIPQKKLSEEIFNQKSVDEHEKDFFGAELKKANFAQLDLIEGDFHSANLPLANLTGADLTGADLTQADLTKANLTEANLTGANLTGANLSGAILVGIDFSTAKIDNVIFGANIKALINIEKMTKGNAWETRSGISGNLNNITLDDSKVIKHINDLFNSKSLKKENFKQMLNIKDSTLQRHLNYLKREIDKHLNFKSTQNKSLFELYPNYTEINQGNRENVIMVKNKIDNIINFVDLIENKIAESTALEKNSGGKESPHSTVTSPRGIIAPSPSPQNSPRKNTGPER